ncbi:MAG: tail fiber protein [Pyrinomonadaceae bacterium]
MADPFVAEIRIFPFNFAPTGWAFCNGQLLPISQNTALFSLLGTFYGGDGKSTFALPDLQGRAPLHQGQGSGLSARFLGEMGGEEFVTLLQSEMPAHNHLPNSASAGGDATTPVGNVWALASFQRGSIDLYHAAPSNGQMSIQAVTPTGGGLPHNNLPPYLVLNFCIAMQGVYPPRT